MRENNAMRRFGRRLWTSQIGLALTYVAGCTGMISDPGNTGSDGAPPIREPGAQPGTVCVADPEQAPADDDTFADARVWRLNAREFAASVASVLGEDLPSVAFPSEAAPNGYDNRASELGVGSVLAQNLWLDVPAIAAVGSTRLIAAASCEPTGPADLTCAQEILEPLVRKAYRRHATPAEMAELLDVFTVGQEGSGFEDGIALVIRVVLQSPDFLYRTELGAAPAMPPPGSVVEMTSDEVATALAYLLTGQPPDETLWALADSGEILAGDVRAREAQRLLQGEPARAQLATFGAAWLEVHDLELLARDAERYPEWATLRSALQEEAGVFFATAVLDDDAALSGLMTANWTVGGTELAAFYGATEEQDGRLQLPPERAGVLTQGGVLAHLAQAVLPSPVKRGHFVRTRLLCQSLVAPDDLVVDPPDPDPTRTNRQQWELFTADPSCQVCHSQLNPIGFAFENFDAVGRFRTEDNGQPVDASGELTGTDVDDSFDNAAELAERLSESSMARACFASHLVEFATGAKPSTSRTNLLLQEGGQCDEERDEASVRELLLTLIQSDAFIRRRVPASATEQ